MQHFGLTEPLRLRESSALCRILTVLVRRYIVDPVSLAMRMSIQNSLV